MKYLFYCLLIFLMGCSGRSVSSNDESEKSSDTYSDGKHCADVTYYNPNTGARNTYTLNVEVENNELVTIYWGNGGWIDNSHFSPTELDSDGSCSFTSDKGYQYSVQITGSECITTDEFKIRSYSNDEDDDEICPKCGREKYSFKKYCRRCIDEEEETKDKEENTCSRCGEFEYYVYGGICSFCKQKERDAEEEEEEVRKKEKQDREDREREEEDNKDDE